MAVVMFAMNGQGLGHLIRSTIVSTALASVGERPVIFSAGEYRPAGLEQFPVRLVPSLWGATDEVRKRVASDLHSMAAISLPSVVVEDTHPAPIQLPAEIRRVLLVRPTSFDYLVRLNELGREIYSAYLLCDSPDSPTWPYDEAQTRQLAGWKNWHGIGPLYRTASEDDVRKVRARYSLRADEEVCVFSMGGGGATVNDPNGQDFVRFFRLALQMAAALQAAGSRARLLFVRGPYFPRRIPIPPRFEVVPEEDQMPALLKIAKAAVIRAGFNTSWECIAAGTPFLPLIGTTYQEPVKERLNRLASRGLVAPDVKSLWFDENWRAEYRRTAKNVFATNSGDPDPLELRRLILDPHKTSATRKPKLPANRRRRSTRGTPLVIRVDDVVCKEPALCWLLDLLATRGLRASLEVVPYLVEFDEEFLDSFDLSGTLFEVSQHGYAHVPGMSDGGSRCEFSPESAMPTGEDIETIARGKRQMEKTFPRRFRGGFSPPYDALPSWLAAQWHELGGAFVSCLQTNSSPTAPLRVVRAGVDMWDWATNRAVDQDTVRKKLALQLALDGHAGIVLHPRCLRNRSAKLHLLRLLNALEEGFTTVSLRDLALRKVDAAIRDGRIGRSPTAFSAKRSQRSDECS